MCTQDSIVTIARETVCEQGTFDELMHANGEFTALMNRHSAGDSPSTTPRATNPGHNGGDGGDVKDMTALSDSQVLMALQGANASGAGGKGGDGADGSGILISLEERTKGKVARATYAFFARQFACFHLVVLAALFLSAQGALFGMDFWMSRWAIGDTSLLPAAATAGTLTAAASKDSSSIDSIGYNYSKQQDEEYLSETADIAAAEQTTTAWFVGGYAVLGFSTFLLSGVRYISLQLVGLGASQKMHNLMLGNLLHAPSSFFDATPVGRIVNRFSGDINCLDFTVPVYLPTTYLPAALHSMPHVFLSLCHTDLISR